jgi:hypothetical protein
MKDTKKVRWLTLLAALGLLYVGIDRMFFDRIVGSDPLAGIERTLVILVGTLLVAVSISLFVAAWTGRRARQVFCVNGHTFSNPVSLVD